jgi:hypothetical protein
MKISDKGSKTFKPAPEFTGRAVCVDVTPLKKVETQFGPKEKFRIVFELDVFEDGEPCNVWSMGFTPILHEKAGLRKFLKQWFGRDLTETELSEFDTESLIGKPASIVVIHEHAENQVYANIAACLPHKNGEPLVPSGSFIRAKDRNPQENGQNPTPFAQSDAGQTTYHRTGSLTQPQTVDHLKVKVHVGTFKGQELRDLSMEAVTALCEKWIPVAKRQAKLSADDGRLMAALEWHVAKQSPETKQEEIPY